MTETVDLIDGVLSVVTGAVVTEGCGSGRATLQLRAKQKSTSRWTIDPTSMLQYAQQTAMQHKHASPVSKKDTLWRTNLFNILSLAQGLCLPAHPSLTLGHLSGLQLSIRYSIDGWKSIPRRRSSASAQGVTLGFGDCRCGP